MTDTPTAEMPAEVETRAEALALQCEATRKGVAEYSGSEKAGELAAQLLAELDRNEKLRGFNLFLLELGKQPSVVSTGCGCATCLALVGTSMHEMAQTVGNHAVELVMKAENVGRFEAAAVLNEMAAEAMRTVFQKPALN